MISFISQILQKLLKSEENISETIFILPSKRAGSFLLNELSKLNQNHLFAPKVYSIEEFAQIISGLQPIDNTISLFEFYEVYRKLTPEEHREDFETFATWAQTLIHDFNELDRYLIDHNSFFNYLSGIQDINHWYLQKKKTELIKNYLKFWQQLPGYYEHLKESLLNRKLGYQGLIYREAAANIVAYASSVSKKHVFIGFNALNNAEQDIIQYLLEKKKAEIHWDLDESFLKDKEHSASIFINQYLKEWRVYKDQDFTPGVDEYCKEKQIELIGVPKNIGQAKYLGELLSGFEESQLENTAVVLGEEDLLLPVLNSLPPNIQDLNITMGFPLKNAALSSLFDNIFHIHLNATSGFYYKDVISIINHPALHSLLKPAADDFSIRIKKENSVYIASEEIIKNFPEVNQPIIKACFEEVNNIPEKLIANFHILTQEIKDFYRKQENRLGLEFLYQFHVLFNKLENLNTTYPHIKSLKSLQGFYKEIMTTQSLDFQGKPFKGLQLMGMLESRALDFETVIITSVNEGILPSGKSNNSFLPFDLKKAYNLPTYSEKNAVYTYHFYRLLQRAKKVYLLYNTEPDGMNTGEKSRFITQLEVEKRPKHKLIKKLISPKVPALTSGLKEVKKTPEVIEKLRELAASGFSPSALTTYIRNPIDFYYRYVLGVKDSDNVEETVAYNTLGTVIHDSLETLYKPLEGKNLTQNDILQFKKRIPEEISLQFKKTYTSAPMNRGKNLLIFEVAKRYLQNFLQQELNRIKNGDEVRILMIEKNLKTQIKIEALDFPVYIRGKVDRLENTNGITRIIDYKTGKVQQAQLKIVDWDLLASDYDKYSKSFQVLTYASLIKNSLDLSPPVEAGVISFKNLQNGFLKFTKNEKANQRGGGKTELDSEIMEAFQTELKKLIAEICDPNKAFIEKEIKNGNY
ncbi:PD-(D/E)XK nuclease family protein [Salegentibacter flavus]|uniref:PD-(D/E)XK nuclease superfamily protein n=1 Tax=Salegentibacter flavus TaxID=287099 RepID=A0A1I5AZC1_9FLAO|nr:PD-(D/E)XK nuclease family protein [Salegentibacter flavus]SFN67803.1 PD-(D/E)XK nuclease superfamily protein [Salegentibacter flavus]